MTRPSLLLPWLPWLLMLSSCSAPPKLPGVDESRRRPVNTTMAVELQSCRSDMENTRLLAAESVRSAEAGSQAMERLTRMAQQQQQELGRGVEVNPSAQRNLLVPVLFGFGSTQIKLPEAVTARIADEARNAPLVILRGRTDGLTASATESAIARQRAAAVEALLVQAGVDRARIRSTWQPVGDHAADNGTAGGRALNRRVEIEIYRAAPIVAVASALDTALAQRPASD